VEQVTQGWFQDLFKGYGHMLIEGLWVTISLALISYIIGVGLGLLGAWAKLSGSKAANIAGETYTTLIRGIPELVLLFLLYFGLEIALRSLFSLLGIPDFEVDRFTIGAIVLSFICGGYLTETMRGAILAVPKGQMEAARAHGMNRVLAFRRILLPQIWRFALPGMGNTWLVLLKDTSIVSAIGLHELMWASKTGGSNTRQEFTFLFAACVIYLVITAISNFAFQTAERHASRGVVRR